MARGICIACSAVAVLAACSDGFELDVTVTSTLPLAQDGAPITSFEVGYTFDSVAKAEQSPIPLEVDDGTGPHVFDLRDQLVYCTENYNLRGELKSERVSLQLIYAANELALRFETAVCQGTDGSYGVIP